MHLLRATRAATKLLRRLAMLPPLRHRLLPLRTQAHRLRLLLRAKLLLQLWPRLRTLALPLRRHRLRLLLRAQASKLHSREARRGLGPGGH